MDRFDAIIVGAGPAGCRAAFRLARGGARVAIVDGSHPREKPCGGGVTARALELVSDAIDARALPARGIPAATFEYRGQSAAVPLATSPPLVVVARAAFDGALLAAAAAAGAWHVAARATDVRPDGTGWAVRTRDGDLHADWLLGADGPNSLVRRRVAAPFARGDLSIATGYYVRGATDGTITIAFEADPAGYLWAFPRPDHLAVGICAQASESSTESLLPIAARWIDAHPGAAGMAERRRYAWPIPSLSESSLRAERPSGSRWMLLGDAAGLVDPITREGIYFALASGGLAADALLRRQDPAREYERALRTSIYPELVRAARLKASFFRPRFMGLLVHGLQRSSRIRAIMADLVAGRQPYRGLRRRLLRTLEWRLMFELAGRRSPVTSRRSRPAP